MILSIIYGEEIISQNSLIIDAWQGLKYNSAVFPAIEKFKQVQVLGASENI